MNWSNNNHINNNHYSSEVSTECSLLGNKHSENSVHQKISATDSVVIFR